MQAVDEVEKKNFFMYQYLINIHRFFFLNRFFDNIGNKFYQIFQKTLVDQDDISCVLSHFQHAVTLLTDEVASQDQPGPILLYFN